MFKFVACKVNTKITQLTCNAKLYHGNHLDDVKEVGKEQGLKVSSISYCQFSLNTRLVRHHGLGVNTANTG